MKLITLKVKTKFTYAMMKNSYYDTWLAQFKLQIIHFIVKNTNTFAAIKHKAK